MLQLYKLGSCIYAGVITCTSVLTTLKIKMKKKEERRMNFTLDLQGTRRKQINPGWGGGGRGGGGGNISPKAH